ncbi:hypothetical protein KY360_03475 [Candidatus Woesearchaeota archaeon]|nr:hypothetical protein [Candidatus Woesearchaeota archaeon]
MGYVRDWYKVRAGEVLSSVFLQSKLVDAEKTFANAIKIRQDIAGVLTRLNMLKRTARSRNKTAKDIENLESGIMGFARDELFRIFAIVESDMLLLHDLTEFLREVVKINNELSREKAAQSSVKINIPTIKSAKDKKKAQQQIEAAKKKLETATDESEKLIELKGVAANYAKEIARLVKETRRELIKFRNQFDAMRRLEIR